MTKIFETQHTALDNCAAACVCTTWRSAVHNSHISVLHMHADGIQNRHWEIFSRSRSSIGLLHLSRQEDSADFDKSWLQTRHVNI